MRIVVIVWIIDIDFVIFVLEVSKVFVKFVRVNVDFWFVISYIVFFYVRIVYVNMIFGVGGRVYVEVIVRLKCWC